MDGRLLGKPLVGDSRRGATRLQYNQTGMSWAAAIASPICPTSCHATASRLDLTVSTVLRGCAGSASAVRCLWLVSPFIWPLANHIPPAGW